MSYNKTTWNSGDVITAEKLNNIESGIEDVSSGGSGGGSFLTIDVVYNSTGNYHEVVSHTLEELYAIPNNSLFMVRIDEYDEGEYAPEPCLFYMDSITASGIGSYIRYNNQKHGYELFGWSVVFDEDQSKPGAAIAEFNQLTIV